MARWKIMTLAHELPGQPARALSVPVLVSCLALAPLLVANADPAPDAREHSPSVRDKVQPVVTRHVESFDLADVKLLDSPFRQAMERNREYLLGLEPDRFLHYFRKEAGLKPKAAPYGGWESPTTGAGRCLGHYLSALALAYRATGDPRFAERISYIVSELALCQQANGNGYLSAQPNLKEVFAELSKGNRDPFMKARVPWYIQHKMFAGLRDAYRLAGEEKARDVLVRLADFAIGITQPLDEKQFQLMLDKEFGGIQEAAADVYAITGDKKYLEFARRFYHKRVQDPWANRVDNLNRLHANTQVPKAIGSARIYELTGDQRERGITEFFWDRVVHHHTYVIGGNSMDEAFGEPDKLATRLNTTTCETCNTYNMLKLTQHLIEWEPRVEYADYFERALYNHILASQEPRLGMFAYFVPLQPGHFRTYSTPAESFWCCVGTGMENHSKYAGAIYFHSADDLYVNLFIPSELTWKEKGLVVRQETRFPETDTVRFTVHCKEPVTVAFKIRHPGWATKELGMKVNGRAISCGSAPGSYAEVRRQWRDGDRLEVKIPLTLRLEPMTDNPRKVAVLYGPLVLAGKLDSSDIKARSPYVRNQLDCAKMPALPVPVLLTENKPVQQWLKPLRGEPLTFQTKGVGRPRDVTLIPFYQLYYDRYTVYWDLAP